MNLVRSNQADTIKSTTQSSFSSLATDADIFKALKILVQLRGIGPATASLLLSVCQPDVVPFFSDELFRWTHWGESGAGRGWERKIKYNVSEYKEIVDRVGQMRKRLGVGATEVEKVAYVLGKEGVDVDRDDGVVESVGVEEAQKVDADSEGKAEEQTGGETSEKVKEETIKAEGAKGQKEKIEASRSSVSKRTEKKGTKRKAQEQKAPVEGTRRSTRRKT